jgi:hypothetical protein
VSVKLIGCFKCGEAVLAEATIYARCRSCGKAVGICLACAVVFPSPADVFVVESLARHIEVRHPGVAFEAGKQLAWKTDRRASISLRTAGAMALAQRGVASQ